MREREKERECVCARESFCKRDIEKVCVFERHLTRQKRERERERESEREKESESVCKRDRETVCACV